MSEETELQQLARESWEKAIIVRQRVLAGMHEIPAGEKTKVRREMRDNYDLAHAAYLESLNMAFAANDALWTGLINAAKAAKAELEEGLKKAKTTVETIKAATKLTGSVTKLIETAKGKTAGGSA